MTNSVRGIIEVLNLGLLFSYTGGCWFGAAALAYEITREKNPSTSDLTLSDEIPLGSDWKSVVSQILCFSLVLTLATKENQQAPLRPRQRDPQWLPEVMVLWFDQPNKSNPMNLFYGDPRPPKDCRHCLQCRTDCCPYPRPDPMKSARYNQYTISKRVKFRFIRTMSLETAAAAAEATPVPIFICVPSNIYSAVKRPAVSKVVSAVSFQLVPFRLPTTWPFAWSVSDWLHSGLLRMTWLISNSTPIPTDLSLIGSFKVNASLLRHESTESARDPSLNDNALADDHSKNESNIAACLCERRENCMMNNQNNGAWMRYQVSRCYHILRAEAPQILLARSEKEQKMSTA